MHDLGLDPSKPYRKSARVVGEVLGKLHPHGDKAVYDALVRLAQDFSMNLSLVDGQGNFGSIDDDPAAAMRYTECRLAPYASMALLDDLDKDTVEFAPNFDASQTEPVVLPSKVPNLLVNGSQGIAVGLGTNIPPHNLGEVVRALRALIQDPTISPGALMQHLPAPDFPTGGELLDVDGLHSVYTAGRGGFTLRAKVTMEGMDSDAGASSSASSSSSGKKARGASRQKPSLVISELPYQVWKGDLVAEIDRLISEKRIEGADYVDDQSDRNTRVRIVVYLRPDADPALVKNQLFKMTRLQVSYQCRMIAVADGVPRQLNIKELLTQFIDHRCITVERRTRHDLKRCTDRLTIVEGLLIAQRSMEMVVKLLNTAKDEAEAEASLCSTLNLTVPQAQAVLGMPLRRLLRLEQDRLVSEKTDLETRIAALNGVLSSRDTVLDVVLREAEAVAAKFPRERRTTVIREASAQLSITDIVPNRPSIVTLSKTGYVKRMPAGNFSTQNRGGRGKTGAKLGEGDEIGEVIHLNDHDMLVFFTRKGDAYNIRALSIPESSRTSKGLALVNLLKVHRGEDADVTACVRLPSEELEAAIRRAPPRSAETDGEESSSDGHEEHLPEHPNERFMVMVTTNGLIKKTPMSEFTNSVGTSRGVKAFKLEEGDELLAARLGSSGDVVCLVTAYGKLLMIPLSILRSASRKSGGVRSVKLKAGDRLIGLAVIPEAESAALKLREATAEPELSAAETDLDEASDQGEDESHLNQLPPPWVLLMSRKGFGKRTPVSLFRTSAARYGGGVKCFNLKRGDEVRSVVMVDSDTSDSDLIISSAQGVINRVRIEEIPVGSRTRGGVKIMSMDAADEVNSLTIAPAASHDE